MTDVLYDNMLTTVVYSGGSPLPAIVNLPNGPFASGTRPRYQGTLVDGVGAGIPAADLDSFTLTIVDTLSGMIINDCDAADILNVGRGTVDDEGNFVITLEVDDTSMTEAPSDDRIQRSLILDWATTDDPPLVGRHQANFILLRLAGS